MKRWEASGGDEQAAIWLRNKRNQDISENLISNQHILLDSAGGPMCLCERSRCVRITDILNLN